MPVVAFKWERRGDVSRREMHTSNPYEAEIRVMLEV